MPPKLLITGVTGLIGNAVLDKLTSDRTNQFQITGLIRPGTKASRFKLFSDRIQAEFIDLSDIPAIQNHLARNAYDAILHIGALRGGRRFSRQQYYQSNVNSTEQLVEYALDKKARLVFCSSVGVFGAIPEEMPANNDCPYKEDNYYHYTKICCEKIINRAILNGLDAVILRPSITYGPGDKGFPFQLVRMVKRRIFPVSNKNIWMHLCHIDAVSTAFAKLVTDKSELSGGAYNIADLEPVRQRDLVNFIYRELFNKNYPGLLTVDNDILIAGEAVSRFLHSELWTARFELIAHSWIYQVRDTYEVLGLAGHYTIPDFRIIIRNFVQPNRRDR